MSTPRLELILYGASVSAALHFFENHMTDSHFEEKAPAIIELL